MKIFKDVIGGDEMLSDTFELTLAYDDAIIKVQSKNRPKDMLIVDDIEPEPVEGEQQQAPGSEPVEMVLDIVANSELKPVNMSKKEFVAYIKDYFKKVVTYLEEHGKADRVDGFKKGAQDFIKYIIPKYDDIELYTGANGENDEGDIVGAICIAYWEKDDAPGPMFYFFKDGLREEAV